MEIYDISQTLCRGIAVWPGDPDFRHRWAARIVNGEFSNVSAVDMCVHTGTHVDAPFHLNDAGTDIAGLSLRHFMGAARVFSLQPEKCIRVADLAPLDWMNVERVLFKTNHREYPENRFNQDFVYFDISASLFLTQKGILLVGTDAPSVDAFNSVDLPSHRILLGHGAAILEGARLESVPPGDYELICLPLKLAGLDGSPVRAILRK
ncbi:MAG: cyclase family protein [Acidobacteria bacterium]|nr:cyclase family protein [Acidobacteriota bacterium]